MGKSIADHISLSIDGALNQSNASLDGILSIDGVDLTGKQVKAFLSSVKSEHGYTHYSGCKNMTSTGKCGGHEGD